MIVVADEDSVNQGGTTSRNGQPVLAVVAAHRRRQKSIGDAAEASVGVPPTALGRHGSQLVSWASVLTHYIFAARVDVLWAFVTDNTTVCRGQCVRVSGCMGALQQLQVISARMLLKALGVDSGGHCKVLFIQTYAATKLALHYTSFDDTLTKTTDDG